MTTIAVVTGGSQGLGLALVDGLARRLGRSPPCGRSPERAAPSICDAASCWLRFAASPLFDLALDPNFYGELIRFGTILPWAA